MRALLLVVFGFAAACASSAPDEVVSDTSTVGTTNETVAATSTTPAPQFCADIQDAQPALLPVGVIQELPDQGKEHRICSSYSHTPPASGSHFPAWQNCGIYTQPIPNQTAVHSLEHGAVWITYQPDLAPATIQFFTEELRSEEFALVSPYPGLQNPIVLTAWTRQLAVDDWSHPAVAEFLDTYVGRASPTAPEAGASCGGAVGAPPDDPNLNYQRIYDQVSGS